MALGGTVPDPQHAEVLDEWLAAVLQAGCCARAPEACGHSVHVKPGGSASGHLQDPLQAHKEQIYVEDAGERKASVQAIGYSTAGDLWPWQHLGVTCISSEIAGAPAVHPVSRVALQGLARMEGVKLVVPRESH